jgi:hypothetical protein
MYKLPAVAILSLAMLHPAPGKVNGPVAPSNEAARMGNAAGPFVFYQQVDGRRTDVYDFRFVGGAPAVIWVEGDGSSDLDCYVLDAAGRIIDSDTDATDTCLLEWTPRSTGTVRLEVRNLGRKANSYEVHTD